MQSCPECGAKKTRWLYSEPYLFGGGEKDVFLCPKCSTQFEVEPRYIILEDIPEKELEAGSELPEGMNW